MKVCYEIDCPFVCSACEYFAQVSQKRKDAEAFYPEDEMAFVGGLP